MTSHGFIVGTAVFVRATFTNPDTDVVVKPEQVRFTYLSPAEAAAPVVVDNIAQDSDGYFEARVDLTCAGKWRTRWETFGTYKVAFEEFLYVHQTIM